MGLAVHQPLFPDALEAGLEIRHQRKVVGYHLFLEWETRRWMDAREKCQKQKGSFRCAQNVYAGVSRAQSHPLGWINHADLFQNPLERPNAA
jgi:hypothetical protein